MPVTLTHEGLLVDGRAVPVYSGSVHYWRLERERWPYILEQVRRLGFNMVETYIPWSVHETAPGEFDWGEIDDRKDIDAFMRLCEKSGTWLIVRPGPLINAELTGFGFPEWVLMDPEVQARTASGSAHFDAAWGLHPPQPFPVPSYASEAFYAAVGKWFDAIVPTIVRHLAPAGCVVAVQSDNETCYLFHDQPYATDYSKDSIALYHSFLRDRYRTLATLNDSYESVFPSFDAVDPPRDCGVEGTADLPLHLDWLEYKEFQIRWSVARIARMLRDRGISDVPIFHDIAWQISHPLDVSRMETDPDIDWVGMNLYCNKEDYWTVAKRIRFLAGATRLPFVPEFGCGLWSHHKRTFMPEEHEFITLSALMNGLKAINFYMLVERERWQGSPITRHGEFRPDYAPFYRDLSAFLARFPLWEFERDRQVLLLLNYDISRHTEMMTTLNVAHADLLGLPAGAFDIEVDFGLNGNPRREADFDHRDSWLNAACRALAGRGAGFDLSDTHVDSDRLDRYPLVCLQTIDFMDPTDQQRLFGYVEDGGRLVLGPEMPRLDPGMRQSEVFARFLDQPGRAEIGKGELIWSSTSGLEGLIDDLVPTPEYSLVRGNADLSVLRREDETLVFVANPGAEPTTTEIIFDGARAFEEVWGQPQTSRYVSRASISLDPYSIRIFRVTCSENETQRSRQ